MLRFRSVRFMPAATAFPMTVGQAPVTIVVPSPAMSLSFDATAEGCR